MSWFSDRYGRKKAFIYCALLSIFGGALLTASQNQAMFIVSRFFAGAGSWAFLSISRYTFAWQLRISDLQSAPTYTAELAPPQKRGFFVGLNGVLLTVGYAIAAYMGLAFYFVDTSSSWRGPLGVALIWPLFILCVLPILPESPRWLLMKGRSEEAWQVLKSIHQGTRTHGESTLRSEFFQIRKQVELDLSFDGSWKGILKRPSYRKRAVLTIGFAFITQSCGPLVINNYVSGL